MVWVAGVKRGGGEVNCVLGPRVELDHAASALTRCNGGGQLHSQGLPPELSKVHTSTYTIPI